MKISDLGTSLSWRRLAVLIRQLPLESRTMRAVGDPSLEWDISTHLLAMIFDTLQGANWQRAKPGTPRPKPTPRPGVGRGNKRGTAMPIPDLIERLHRDDEKG